MENGGNNIETHKRLDEIEATLKEIRTALLGNEFNGNGYLRKIDGLENRVEKLEKYNAAQMWFFLGAGGLGGAGLVKFIEYFTH